MSAVETIPPGALPQRKKEVDLHMFADSGHAGNKRTRRSRTGFIVYMSMSLIDWYSKKESTVETSVFGTEFVAMRVRVETLCAI